MSQPNARCRWCAPMSYEVVVRLRPVAGSSLHSFGRHETAASIFNLLQSTGAEINYCYA